jgi:hypothetical protein
VGLTYIVRVDSLYFVSHPHDSSAPPFLFPVLPCPSPSSFAPPFLFPVSRRCTASPAAARHTHCHRRSTRVVAAPSPITAWRTWAPLMAGCAPLLLIPAALAGSSSLGSTSCRGVGERCLSGEGKLPGVSLSDGGFVLFDICLWNITYSK